jgi:lipoyl(octanoyl) transferase
MNSGALSIQNWGRIAYREAWARQKELLEARIRDEIPDTLVFCEHEPVITLGRAFEREGGPLPQAPGLEVISVERGGLATYHGPGQIVAYPIFKLAPRSPLPGRAGVVDLIRSLENWLIAFLKSEGLDAGVLEGKTGIWMEKSRKIGSIGIAARHWVSYHGVALNFGTGREVWGLFNPCGLSADVMTDLNLETSKDFTYGSLVDSLSSSAENYFASTVLTHGVKTTPRPQIVTR